MGGSRAERRRAECALDRPALVCLAVLLTVSCSSESPELPETVLGELGRSPGKFYSPRSVAVHPKGGELCVVDRSGRVQRFVREQSDAGVEWRHASQWVLSEYEKGQPTGIQYARNETLLIADTHYQRVLRYDPRTGELLASFGRRGHGPGEFSQVRDVVEDGDGNIFAGDFSGPRDRVQKFDADGRFLLEFGATGDAPGEFRRPQGMVIHRIGAGGASGEDSGTGARETLLVADSCNHRIQRFGLGGELLGSFGTLGEGPGEMRYPYGVTAGPEVDSDIFVVEWQNNRVQRFDARGRPLGAWGGPGREPGRLATPWDVAIGPEKRLFVADFGNHRVQVFRWPHAPRPPRETARSAVRETARNAAGAIPQ